MLKNLVNFAINKPILNHILLVFLFVLSIFAYMSIPKEIFPPISLEKISIIGSYPGSSVNAMNNMAVSVIEEEIESINGIEEIESVIKSGFFTILATLKTSADKQSVLDDVKDAISNIRKDLPSDMNEPIAKAVQNSYPLVAVSISASVSQDELLGVAKRIKKDISKIESLSNVLIRGDAETELIITLDTKKIQAHGLNPSLVASAISSLSVIFPIGETKENGVFTYISTQSGKKTIEELKQTKLNLGKIISLGDISNIEYKLSDISTLSTYNSSPSIAIDINKDKSGNAITLVKEIKQILSTYQNEYKDYKFDVYSDSSIWIRNRLNTVVSNIIFGIILVILAMYLLINGRIAFVVGLGIPVSFMIALVFTHLLGYSINMLSLLGALIALGMLVDEAIVVSENIYKHIENGLPPKEAAIKGSLEMFPAVLTATMTTIFAFLPLLIMSGEMGLFMKILPIMITILLISSLFEAFFFLPLHAKEILRANTKPKYSDKVWAYLKPKYKNILNMFFSRPKIYSCLMLTSIIALTYLSMKNTRFQLFPTFDTTQVFISGKVKIDNEVQDTKEILSKLEKTLLEKLDMQNEISSISSVYGLKLDAQYKPQLGENYFQIFIDLYERVPQNIFDKYINPYLSPSYDDKRMRREQSAKQITQKLSKIVANINQSEYEEIQVVLPQAGIVKSDIEISLSGSNKDIKQAISRLEQNLSNIKSVSNITNNAQLGKSEIKLHINDYAETLGITEQHIFNTLRSMYFKTQQASMFKNNELIEIKTQMLDKNKIESLKEFPIHIPNTNQLIALKELVTFKYIQNYEQMIKINSLSERTVSASLDKTQNTSAEILTLLKDDIKYIQDNLNVNIQIKGEQKENDKIQKEMGQAALIAMFLIFITLVWMFDSMLFSTMVLLNIPLSVLGVLVGHFIMGINLTMPGALGIVGLCGVVVNDGIIMLNFIKAATSKDEVIKIAITRLRPILITSITTVLGLSSLIFFASGQALILQPMAISLGFGLLWATVLNLILLPTLYYAIKGE
ncbi:MAG: RND multidrug efflux transporter; Acriflavin resistance protein [uncultured Campylobacterales bacterium]|uniref:RND multidrug efflux transporter Acriflavin resistance protein n=1 Tax=uncultured Campylobacterales bacterium TaxID=352960 RepID=A0A6S6S3E6_9BACT|nr:MAG: RND multidrug efflux transporter; Acriflavin resistance protein [uncultured Campylobacterales bacterium]